MKTHSFWVLCPEFEEGDNFSVENKDVTCSNCIVALNQRNERRPTKRAPDFGDCAPLKVYPSPEADPASEDESKPAQSG